MPHPRGQLDSEGGSPLGAKRLLAFPTHNPTHSTQRLVRLSKTYAAFGSPRGFVSCWKTNSRRTDKGEVGGSSPPRPTIQITSKYASILTFPLFGALPQKTVLSTVCQLHDWPDGTTLRALRPFE
jgi:hypothetical protein